MKHNLLNKFLLIFLCALFLSVCANAENTYAQNYDFNIDANGVLTSYTGNGGNIVIPKNVKEIGDNAFSGNTTITSVQMSASVTSIGKSAFDSCYSLTKIKLSSKLTAIGDNAFWGCTSLKSISIPKSVKEIGFGAFVHCDNLKSIYIPKSITKIGNYSFGFMYYGDYVPIIDFTLLGEKHSSAQDYAQKYNLSFISKDHLKTSLSSLKKDKSRKIVIGWKKNTSVTGYEIQISTNKKFASSKTKSIYIKNCKTTKYSVKRLGTIKNYIRIRGYRTISGKKYYSSWSKVKTI